MSNSSIIVKSFIVALLAAAAAATASCAATPGSAPPANSELPTATVPGTVHPLGSSKNQFVFSLTPPSLTFLHATSPAQTITIVVADQRAIITVVQDPTVANAVLNVASITQIQGGGFQETITVTPLKPGITNLFLNTQQGTVATIPIDVYAELQASVITGNVIQCKKPSACTAASTLGGASLGVQEQFYPNSFSLNLGTVCQTANGSTSLATSGNVALQLTPAGYTTLVNNAFATNLKTQSLSCTTTVTDDHGGTQTTTQTFTVTFQSLNRGAGL
jgi:hypothetical protein